MEQIETTGALSFEEQAALVMKLKDRLGGGEHGQEVRTLLARLRRRSDLYARIAEEVDDLLDHKMKVGTKSQPSFAQAASFVATTLIDTVRPQQVACCPEVAPCIDVRARTCCRDDARAGRGAAR